MEKSAQPTKKESSKFSQFFKKRSTKEFQGVLWILPALALLCLFCLYPTITAFTNSFTDWDGVHTPDFVWFENYSELFQDKLFWKSFLNVVILTIVGMVLGNAASLFLSELMYNMTSKVAAVYRFLFVLPAMVPGIIVMLLWQKLILSGTSMSVANTLLGLYGIKPIEWFQSDNTAIVFFSIFVYGFPWMGGTSFLIYLAGLNGIDPSIVEASRLDGVGTFRRIFVIDLPLIKGQIKYFLVMGIIGGLQNYSMQYAITKGGPGEIIADMESGTMVPGYYIYSLLFESSRPDAYGYACAIGVMMFVIIMIITVINNKFINSKED